MNACQQCGRVLSPQEAEEMRQTCDTDCPSCGFDFCPPQLVPSAQRDESPLHQPGEVYLQGYQVRGI